MEAIKNKPRIILCQPDEIKGCSVCCGLFNFKDISGSILEQFLAFGKYRVDHIFCIDYFDDSEESRDYTSHICPYQGFLKGRSKPGCLVHPKTSCSDGRDASLFGIKICSEFFCPAHIILNDDMKKTLIDYVDGWYEYSIAVLDPESFVWMVDSIKSAIKCNLDEWHNKLQIKQALSRMLVMQAEYMSNIQSPIFYYSISEYNLNKHLFSVLSGGKLHEPHRERMRQVIKELFG